jgi:hypothetical protein
VLSEFSLLSATLGDEGDERGKQSLFPSFLLPAARQYDLTRTLNSKVFLPIIAIRLNTMIFTNQYLSVCYKALSTKQNKNKTVDTKVCQ